MPTTSVRVRTSMPNRFRRPSGVCTSSRSRSGIVPPMWYGMPQLANETYGPRSNRTISAVLRQPPRPAAADMPPATPPTITMRVCFSIQRYSVGLRPPAAGQAVPLWQVSRMH